MKNQILSLMGMILILSSCSDFNGPIENPVDLKNAISDRYGAEQLKISIKNQNSISVSLTDSSLQDLSPQKKQDIAREIGEMAMEMSPEGFETATVSFVKTTDFGIVKSSDSVTFEMFPEGIQ